MVTIEKKKSFEDLNLVLKRDETENSNRHFVSIDSRQVLNEDVNKYAETITDDINNLFDDETQIINHEDEIHCNIQTVTIDIKKMLDDVKKSVMNKKASSFYTIGIDNKIAFNKENFDASGAMTETESQENEEVIALAQEPLVTSISETDHMSIKKKKSFPHSRLVTIFSDVTFYSIIVLIGILAVFYIGTNNSLFGYQLYNVIDTSMEPKFQQGSILIVKDIEPSNMEIGDAITFYQNEDTIITREIIAIDGDNDDISEYEFQTRQINNEEYDVEIALSSNVFGKVITHIPYLGSVDTFMNRHIEIILIAFTIIIIVTSIMHYFFGVEKKKS